MQNTDAVARAAAQLSTSIGDLPPSTTGTFQDVDGVAAAKAPRQNSDTVAGAAAAH